VPPPCGLFAPKTKNEKAYVRLPKDLNQEFHLIIIDARFRRHCVQTAKEVLTPDGVVIMHDAHKAHYQTGLGQFRHSVFLYSGKWYPFQNEPNKVWIGCNGRADFLCQFKDCSKKLSGDQQDVL